MASPSLIVLFTFISLSYAIENLKLAYQWKFVDFQYPSVEARQNALQSGAFVPANNLILGLEVYGDRLFITVPRWKKGVPASLTYINLKDKSESPRLNPYPNWDAHKLPESEDGDPPEIVSPFRVRADRCGRLWVMDTGVEEPIGNARVYRPASILIYDLNTDKLIRRYPIPEDQVTKSSFLANLAIEDEDCTNTYGYFGDLGDPAVVVYSYLMNSSWRIKHHFFHFNPLFTVFNVDGESFTWLDGIFGMGLTAPGPDGVTTLFFHPMSGTEEFSVSTRYLRNSSLSETNFHKFRALGNRGPNGQSGVSFLDKKTGVLFYALINHNSIGCWITSNPTYTRENQGLVHESDKDLIFPNDIKVDANDNIWVLSDRLPQFLYHSLNGSEFNFRILTASVSEAVKGTVCDANQGNSGSSISSSQPGNSLSQAELDNVFNKFNRPGTSPPVAIRPQTINRAPVQAFAVAEIPPMPNRSKQPPIQFLGNPDLAFSYKPLPLAAPLGAPSGAPSGIPANVFNNFRPQTQVSADMTKTKDEGKDGEIKKGLEFLINIPVNLYLSVETP